MGDTSRIVILVAAALASVTIPESVESAAPPSLLTFAASNSRAFGLCLVRADGSRPIRLTRRPASAPSWSPDARRVAFVRGGFERTTGAVVDVLLADARGRVLRNVSNGYARYNYDPSWSADGHKLVYTAGNHGSLLVVVDLRTGRRRELTARPTEPRSKDPEHPSWSPRGDWIAFDAQTFDANYLGAGRSIFLIRPDGTGARELIRHAEDPTWSPDGRQIAFLQRRAFGAEPDVAVANADGSGAHFITDTPDEEAQPAWSPDGRLIAFTRRRGRTIVVTRANGSNERIVATARDGPSDPGGVATPAWRPAASLPRHKYGRCVQLSPPRA